MPKSGFRQLVVRNQIRPPNRTNQFKNHVPPRPQNRENWYPNVRNLIVRGSTIQILHIWVPVFTVLRKELNSFL
jgi:hypothetical protein